MGRKTPAELGTKVLFEHEKQVKRWIKAEQQYRDRSRDANNLAWLLRRMDPGTVPVDKAALIAFIDLEKEAIAEKQRGQAAEKAKAIGSDTPVIPMIQDDTLLLLGQCRDLIESQPKDRIRDGEVIPCLERIMHLLDLDLKAQLDWMVKQAQIGLEMIGLLVCRANPRWAQAGDILVHMWETLIHNGLKPGIFMHHKPGVDPVQEFGMNLKLEDLIIETRVEREAREARGKAGSDE